MADPEYTDGSAPTADDDAPDVDPSEQLAAAVESLHHELEALGQYDQWLAVTDDPDLVAILTANRDDEYDHANKLIGWIVQNDPTFDADAATASLKEAIMAAVTDRSLGGKPKPGGKKDGRLKENKPGPAMPMAATDAPAPDTQETAATGAAFTTLMMVEGLETSDGRMFELGSTTWRTPPIPFMVQDTSPHGPGQTPAPAWAAGQIDSIERDPDDSSRIIGHGHLMANAAGQKAEELIRGAMRGVSVDAYGDSPLPPDVQPTVVDEDGRTVDALIRYADSVLSRLTLVPTPAFAPCCVWMDDEDMPQAAADAHGSVIDPDAEPEVVQMPGNAFEMLVAAAGGPLNPPRDWFFTPEPSGYQPLEVTADGHITGHIARTGQCYLGEKKCLTAPPSHTTPPYKSFHRTVAHCADGTEVACGFLTMNTKHEKALLSVGPGVAMDHYDHTGTIGAKVRCSNGRFGTWCSGAVLPGLADRELSILQGPEVSGDWRKWQDPDDGRWHPLELLGLLAVPVPAYPGTRTRPELLVASATGEVLAMQGQLEPDCADCAEGDDMSAEDLGRISTLEAQVAALLSAAPDDVLAALAGAGDDDSSNDTDFEDAAASEGSDVALAEGADESFDADTPLSAAEHARWFAKYNTADRKKMADSGAARPDGSYPVADEEDLAKAIQAVGPGNGSHNAIRAHIIKRAGVLGKSSMIPDNWNSDGSLKP